MNIYKRNQKNNKKKGKMSSKTEEMKEIDRNLRAEMAILDKNESMCHKIWADLYLIRKFFIDITMCQVKKIFWLNMKRC
jgi:hypothetical protein